MSRVLWTSKVLHSGLKPLSAYQAKSGDCKGCPHLEKCVASRGGKNPKRTLYIADSPGGKILEAMREKIDDPRNRELYGRRMSDKKPLAVLAIEPCFADIEYCKRMNRFSLRGKQKVAGQWLLFCIVHNIGKCVPKSPGPLPRAGRAA